MDKLIIIIVLAVISCGGEATTCLNARNKCISRIGCSMALNNLLIACESVRLGTDNYCTEACMRAVISLVTVNDDIGTNYLTCDCDGSADCELTKKRISLCSDGVLAALKTLDNEKVISCSLARMLCEADTSCWTALSYYEENCNQLWSRRADNLQCTSQCNNSVSILFRQKRATKLKNCMCDNSDPIVDEITCIRMRYNTATFCLKKEPEWPFFRTSKKENYDNYSKLTLASPAALRSSGSSMRDTSVIPAVTLLLALVLSNLT